VPILPTQQQQTPNNKQSTKQTKIINKVIPQQLSPNQATKHLIREIETPNIHQQTKKKQETQFHVEIP
jgi:hypothetical protein